MTATLKYSKNIFCPACERKICKIVDSESGPAVEFRHKQAEVIGPLMAIKCIGCKRSYMVSAQDGVLT